MEGKKGQMVSGNSGGAEIESRRSTSKIKEYEYAGKREGMDVGWKKGKIDI